MCIFLETKSIFLWMINNAKLPRWNLEWKINVWIKKKNGYNQGPLGRKACDGCEGAAPPEKNKRDWKKGRSGGGDAHRCCVWCVQAFSRPLGRSYNWITFPLISPQGGRKKKKKERKYSSAPPSIRFLLPRPQPSSAVPPKTSTRWHRK